MKTFFCICLIVPLMLLTRPNQAQILKTEIPDRLVVLTFDDAVSTHATFVAPILKKYGFGATFFVCEFPPDFEDKHKYMSWEQMKELHKMGFEIANHTKTHKHVNQMDKEEMNQQLAYIEQKAENMGADKIRSFAYPAYDTAALAYEVLRERGYLWARIGDERAYDPEKDHPYLIPSFSTAVTDKEQILKAINQARNGKIVVLTVHGVPDYAHDWVTTPPELFEAYMSYLHEHHFQVIAVRDLARFIDPLEANKLLSPVNNH